MTTAEKTCMAGRLFRQNLRDANRRYGVDTHNPRPERFGTGDRFSLARRACPPGNVFTSFGPNRDKFVWLRNCIYPEESVCKGIFLWQNIFFVIIQYFKKPSLADFIISGYPLGYYP